MRRQLRSAVLIFVLLGICSAAWAQGPVGYRITIPAPEQGWMQVELILGDLPPGPIDLHMSRSSPGRYALHEFGRNVSNVQADDGRGAPLAVSHPEPSEWRIERHGAVIRVRYRVSGRVTDGTYLGIDATHAHINMPAALMWVRGLEERPVSIAFDPPDGHGWRVATQLFPGADARTFTAPNLQYLMDSPTELSAFALRTFSVSDGGRTTTFRLAVHHQGSDDDVRELASDAERIVREAARVFGELPAFDNGSYTFLADYLPSVVPDGMEHRNSAVLTSRGAIATSRAELRSSMAHEFFHAWNVERIRPRSLEPFNFDATNPSSELWLAEGFTQYYGPLVLTRAGLTSAAEFARELGGMVGEVVASPARLGRTLEEMSRLATVVDGAAVADVAGFRNTFLSYYTWGGAVALGLDLTLRERTDGRVTLDTFMRALWERHGRLGGREPGYVDNPYTVSDLDSALASVAGDEHFAADFFSKYIQGHELVDYDRLLGLAGFVWRPVARGGRVLVPIEDTGRTLTDAQRRFRAAWLAGPLRAARS